MSTCWVRCHGQHDCQQCSAGYAQAECAGINLTCPTTLAGRQDPYCVLSIGMRTFRSATHTDGGRAPVRLRALRAVSWYGAYFGSCVLTLVRPRCFLGFPQVWNETFSFTNVTADQVLRMEVRRGELACHAGISPLLTCHQCMRPFHTSCCAVLR